MAEAIPIVLGTVLIINILYAVSVFDAIADAAAPIVTTVLGMPKEAVVALVMGFLRKDVALGLMAPLDMTSGQLVAGSVVLAMSFPCIATFVTLLREFGLRGVLKATGIMVVAALITGGILNLILN